MKGRHAAELLPPECHANHAFTATSEGQIPPKSDSYPGIANRLFYTKCAWELMCVELEGDIYVGR